MENIDSKYHTIQHLRDTHCCDIPTDPGIYTISIPPHFQVRFRNVTTAITTFNGLNLLYPSDELRVKFERGDRHTLYIGKAAGRQGLRQRLRQMIHYGWGEGVNKRGGRAIWQIENCYSLLVGYCECDNPQIAEHEALCDYFDRFDVLPVANWNL